MGMKKHERAIARLMKQIKAAPEHDGIDYQFLALAGLEVAELAFAAMRDDLWIVDDAAVILGDAMAEAAQTGPERWIGRIEDPARALAQAGRDSEWDDADQDDDWTDPVSDHGPRGLDLSRFRAAPSARLSHFPFERDRAFPSEG